MIYYEVINNNCILPIGTVFKFEKSDNIKEDSHYIYVYNHRIFKDYLKKQYDYNGKINSVASIFNGQKKFFLILKGNELTYKDFSCTVVLSPTGNCQLASFNYFQSVLKFEKDLEKILSCIGLYKNLLLIDIHADLFEEKLELLGKYILISNPYESTNGSNMVLAILKIPQCNNIKFKSYNADNVLECLNPEEIF